MYTNALELFIRGYSPLLRLAQLSKAVPYELRLKLLTVVTSEKCIISCSPESVVEEDSLLRCCASLAQHHHSWMHRTNRIWQRLLWKVPPPRYNLPRAC